MKIAYLLLMALTQSIPDDQKNDDGAETSASKLFGAVGRYQSSEEIIHLSGLGGKIQKKA